MAGYRNRPNAAWHFQSSTRGSTRALPNFENFVEISTRAARRAGVSDYEISWSLEMARTSKLPNIGCLLSDDGRQPAGASRQLRARRRKLEISKGAELLVGVTVCEASEIPKSTRCSFVLRKFETRPPGALPQRRLHRRNLEISTFTWKHVGVIVNGL